jgi:hypothetical protein
MHAQAAHDLECHGPGQLTMGYRKNIPKLLLDN